MSGGRVFLGMSGGVDSALAAALLVEQGFDVRAVYMKNWSRDLPGFKCAWADDLADAERVAVSLGIDLAVWDMEREYKKTVVDYAVDAYAHGYTPNPDVMCNQTVKFGSFARRAFAEGADFIATGHYARVWRAGTPAPAGIGEPGVETDAPVGADMDVPAVPEQPLEPPARLFRAADEHKDQTYFLWRVGAGILARTLFPIGGIPSKDEVRRMCAERGLGVESKPDSDGICFIGPVGMRTFLLDTLDRAPGDIVEWETGTRLGAHDGAFLFTVGQRKGLDLGGGPRRYVVATDVENNVVYVTANRECPALRTRKVVLEDAMWIGGRAPREGACLVRTRHTGELRTAHVEPLDGKALVSFDEPVPVVAAGQSVVIYDGLECLGGGLAAKAQVVPPFA